MLRKLAILFLLLYSNVSLAVTLGDLNNDIKSVQTGKAPDKKLVIKLIEMVDTTVAYTKALYNVSDKAGSLFCIPEGTKMDFNSIVKLIGQRAEKEKASESEPVREIFLRMLMEHHPCEI